MSTFWPWFQKKRQGNGTLQTHYVICYNLMVFMYDMIINISTNMFDIRVYRSKGVFLGAAPKLYLFVKMCPKMLKLLCLLKWTFFRYCVRFNSQTDTKIRQ